MNKNNIIKGVLALSLAAASTAVLAGCGEAQVTGALQAQIPHVKTITLSAVTNGLNGKVSVNETVEIYSKLPGRIASISVEEGTQVKKGDVLAQLEANELEVQVNKAQAGLDAAQAKLADALAGSRKEDIRAAQGNLQAAQAAVEQAKANLDQVEISYNQAKNYYDLGQISKDELTKATTSYKSAKATYDSAAANAASAQATLDLLIAGPTTAAINQLRAGVTAAEADLESAQISLHNASIISPIDGTVVKKNAKAGEMAFASMPSGASLMQLVSLDPAKIEVSVPETDIQQMKEGDILEVQIPSLPDKKLQGKVIFISPVSDPNNNTFTVKLMVPNPDNLLRSGNLVVVKLTGSQTNRIEIPKAAILEKSGKSMLYKIEGEHVKELEVTTESKNQDWVYLKNDSGLKSEDKIVLSPSNDLTDQMKVILE